MDRFVDLCVASLACTNSVNYIFPENSRKILHYYSMQNVSVFAVLGVCMGASLGIFKVHV